MRILIITKRFPPETPATAVLGDELAAELARRGCEVTVAAGYPHHPYGRPFPGYRPRLVSREARHGFRLVRSWHFMHPSPHLVVRFLIMVSQCLSSLLCACFSRRPDVVVSFDGYPLLGPLTAAIAARRFGAKAVSVIYDLYPDIAVELGKLRHPGFISLARRLENLVYRSSDRIVVLSEGFRRTLIQEKGVDPAKVEVIPVWLDGHAIEPLSRANAWRREQDLPADKFIVLYAGTIGLVSGAGVIADAARLLAVEPEIMFLLVGDGYGKEQVAARARELGLTNLRLLPFQPRERLSELQAVADVAVVTLAPGYGKTSVPSKILGYMAAARPVVAAVDEGCDTATLIRQADCGLVVPPGDVQALAQAICHYYRDRTAARAAGKQGRVYFLKHFEKRQIIRQYFDLLNNLVKS